MVGRSGGNQQGDKVIVTRRVRGRRRLPILEVPADRLGRAVLNRYREERYDKVIEQEGVVAFRGPLLVYVKFAGVPGLYAADPSQVRPADGKQAA